MDNELPDFGRAEYLPSSHAPAPPVPSPGVLPPSPYTASDGEVLRPAAPPRNDYEPDTASHATFMRAVLFGFLGALLGSVIYAVVGHWVQIGYVAILVGAMVGGGMMQGSDGVGGRRYQVAAVLLTYFAVSLAFTLDVLWDLAQHGHQLSSWIPGHLVLLLSLVLGGPFFELASPVSGLIGLLILFFGMQAAWRISKGGAVVARFNKPDPRSPLGLR